MGTWGVGLFSDDLAADIRNDFRDLIGEGNTAAEATNRLQAEYATSLTDPEEASVFWLALAVAQWNLGRIEESVRQKALEIIDSKRDLARWTTPKEQRQRATVLAKIRAQLVSPAPPPKSVRRPIKGINDWEIGEIIALRLLSGRLTLLRTSGHH